MVYSIHMLPAWHSTKKNGPQNLYIKIVIPKIVKQQLGQSNENKFTEVSLVLKIKNTVDFCFCTLLLFHFAAMLHAVAKCHSQL